MHAYTIIYSGQKECTQAGLFRGRLLLSRWRYISREEGIQCHVYTGTDGILWIELATESSQSPSITSCFNQGEY